MPFFVKAALAMLGRVLAGKRLVTPKELAILVAVLIVPVTAAAVVVFTAVTFGLYELLHALGAA